MFANYFAQLGIATLAVSAVTALPKNPWNNPAASIQPVCGRRFGALPTKPTCCGNDLVNLVFTGCTAPVPVPRDATEFTNVCDEQLKDPQCCASTTVCYVNLGSIPQVRLIAYIQSA